MGEGMGEMEGSVLATLEVDIKMPSQADAPLWQNAKDALVVDIRCLAPWVLTAQQDVKDWGGQYWGVPVCHKVSGASHKVSGAKYNEMSVSVCWEKMCFVS